jgi:hypothetical protein
MFRHYRIITFVILAGLVFLPGLSSEENAADSVPMLVRSRFGESKWSRALAGELASYVRESGISRDALALILQSCDRTMESVEAGEAARAIFTFACECDISLKRGEYPARLQAELRSMMRSGSSDTRQFEERLRLRSRETYRMIEQLKKGSSKKKKYRYLGGGSGRISHGRPGDEP